MSKPPGTTAPPSSPIWGKMHEQLPAAAGAWSAAAAASIIVFKTAAKMQGRTITLTLPNDNLATLRLATLVGTAPFIVTTTLVPLTLLADRIPFLARREPKDKVLASAIANWLCRVVCWTTALGTPFAVGQLKPSDQVKVCAFIGAAGGILWYFTPAPPPKSSRSHRTKSNGAKGAPAATDSSTPAAES